MRQLTLLLAVLTASPTFAAEGTITVRACVLDTEAGTGAAHAAEAAIGNGPALQILSDGLVQVRHELSLESSAAGECVTVEFVAN